MGWVEGKFAGSYQAFGISNHHNIERIPVLIAYFCNIRVQVTAESGYLPGRFNSHRPDVCRANVEYARQSVETLTGIVGVEGKLHVGQLNPRTSERISILRH
jgi:hypothetical protein